MKNSCTVIMSTYNGEKYLPMQLDSIIKQKDVDVNLYIRDDGSKDKTISIIKEYQSKSQIKILLEKGSNVGAAQSFMQALFDCEDESEYYALSDQDDVWKVNKLIEAINKIQNPNELCVYYSSTDLIDKNGKYIATKKYPQISKENMFFGYFGSGCTFVFTREFLHFLRKYMPSKMYMHDAWILSMGCMFGKTIYDDNSYIGYRQHDSNVVGVNKKRNLEKKINDFFNKNKKRHSTIAKELLNGYRQYMTKDDKNYINMIVEYDMNLASKISLISSKYIKKLPKKDRRSVIREILFDTF